MKINGKHANGKVAKSNGRLATGRQQDSWPKVSVIIPLHGGAQEIRNCLESLRLAEDLVHEVVVVDNASPDEAATVVEEFACKLVHNENNKGYAAACNQGLEASTGDVIVFLNSDTYVTRAGLTELVNSLLSSGTIGAAGPYTNNCAHLQRVPVTYTSLATVELFARDWAARQAQDRECDMLVGFCLAARRATLDEIGGFDERFGLGTFEDNDLCYRLRRAGYKLVISAKSFIHHEGSKTLQRMALNPAELLERNQKLYAKKWRQDLETGFASSLSGLTSEAIRFDNSKKPESILATLKPLVERADISFCMIARDEERCIAECLDSIAPFVTEMIVVDTGSGDKTAEIAKRCGAKVFHFPWTKSFAEARNESLRHAKGRWIFWADADDVLPIQSGVEIVNNALAACEKIGGFVIPVQFVDDGPVGGVRVDHVKLFRNDPALRFTHRIHEQILESLRARGYEIARSQAVVLHANYDTSQPGQEKKRNRDRELLSRDLKENPGHPFVMFNLGMTAHYLKRYAQAERWLRKSIRACDGEESHLRKAYDLLALSLIARGRNREAEQVLRTGLAKMPDDAEMNFHLGQLLAGKEEFAEARACYDKVLSADMSSVFSSVDMGIFGYKSLHNRAEIDFRLKDYANSKEGFLSALQQVPDFLASAFCLFEVALENKDFLTARGMLEHVRRLEGFSESWSKMTARYGAAVIDLGLALDLLRRAFETDANALAPRMEFCRLLLNAGDISNALPHLMFLQERGVAEAAHFLGMVHSQSGQLKAAHNWFKRAQSLNPGHTQTEEALTKLEEAIRGAA